MTLNRRRHRIRLAKKWSGIWSDSPKVPILRRYENKFFY